MGLKVTKVIVVDDEGKEIVLDVLDSTILAVCAGESAEQTRVLSQVTTNASINFELMKRMLATSPAAVVPTEAPAE